jgi:hypothetical protein
MSVEEKNKHHLFIATQDDELRQKVGRKTGIVLYLLFTATQNDGMKMKLCWSFLLHFRSSAECQAYLSSWQIEP